MEQALSPADFDTLLYSSAFLSQNKDKIAHGFFGRNGGHSTGIYNSLNCGPGSDDAQNTIAQNRKIISQAIGCTPDNLLSLYQIHGDKCLSITEPWKKNTRPKADGFVTDIPGIALGILTADCAPVLFYGHKSNNAPVIGAAHAGWGGALKGILAVTIEEMLALGAIKNSIQACIGPCITQASYEVKDTFAAAFLKEDEENERFFKTAQQQEHLMFDLSGYCAFKLYKAGIQNIEIKDLDTYTQENNFFSYRRATHKKETDYGRQISSIMIKADN